MRSASTLRNAVFAAGVLGGLVFGGAQAFATPQPQTDVAFCNSTVCAAGCIAKGYWGGECIQNYGCYCYRIDQ